MQLPVPSTPATSPGPLPVHLLIAGLTGVAFARMDSMLKPYAKTFKRQDNPYSLRNPLAYNALSSQQSEVAAAAASGEGELYTQLT